MWHEFESADQCVPALAGDICVRLKHAIQTTGRAGLAVSGGRSPRELFDALSLVELPWDQVDISLVDERFLAPEDADSNERLVRSHLLQHKAARAHFTGLVSDPLDLQGSLERANSQAADLTIVLLGMGEDGHTASLFPDARQLEQGLSLDAPQRYIHVTPPSAAHERISMTLAAILSAQHIIVHITGDHKRKIMSKAMESISPALPISYVIAHAKAPCDIYWNT